MPRRQQTFTVIVCNGGDGVRYFNRQATEILMHAIERIVREELEAEAKTKGLPSPVIDEETWAKSWLEAADIVWGPEEEAG